MHVRAFMLTWVVHVLIGLPLACMMHRSLSFYGIFTLFRPIVSSYFSSLALFVVSGTLGYVYSTDRRNWVLWTSIIPALFGCIVSLFWGVPLLFVPLRIIAPLLIKWEDYKETHLDRLILAQFKCTERVDCFEKITHSLQGSFRSGGFMFVIHGVGFGVMVVMMLTLGPSKKGKQMKPFPLEEKG